MKKFFTLIMVVVSAFVASCTNDDVPIEDYTDTTFKVYLNNIVDIPNIYEVYTGELESVSKGYKLRVRLLVYNSDGTLVASETEYFSSYNDIMSTTMTLEEGKYYAVAITDVINSDGKFSYWILSDENSINSARVTDNGYIGGQNKFLGVGSVEFSLFTSTEEVTIKPSLAGAIILSMWRNVNAYNNVNKTTLVSNRISKYMALNWYGGIDYVLDNDNNNFKWRVSYLERAKYPDSKNVYAYFFSFPMKNVSFKYTIETSDIGTLETDTFTMNLEAGYEYYFCLNLKDPDQGDEVTHTAYKIGGTKSSPVIPEIEESVPAESTMSLMELIKLTDKTE